MEMDMNMHHVEQKQEIPNLKEIESIKITSFTI
jgi:hypothetical protein